MVHSYKQRLTIELCLAMLFFSKNQILHLFKLLFASKRILSFMILIIVSSLSNNTTPKTRYSTISLLTKLINNNNRRLYRYSKFSSLLGNYKQFIEAIKGWVKRKGIRAGTYSIKTRRRSGSKSKKASEDNALVMGIVFAILRNGVKARPFFFKQRARVKKEFIDRLNALLK